MSAIDPCFPWSILLAILSTLSMKRTIPHQGSRHPSSYAPPPVICLLCSAILFTAANSPNYETASTAAAHKGVQLRVGHHYAFYSDDKDRHVLLIVGTVFPMLNGLAFWANSYEMALTNRGKLVGCTTAQASSFGPRKDGIARRRRTSGTRGRPKNTRGRRLWKMVSEGSTLD